MLRITDYLTKISKTMKKAFLAISAYFISALIGISFFIFLFKVLTFNYFLGMGIISLLVLVASMLILDKDFIQEPEEAQF